MRSDTDAGSGLDRYLVDDGETATLKGGVCGACGSRRFPLVDVCFTCHRSGTMRGIQLAASGTVYAFTKLSVVPRGFGRSYVVGFVDLDDGVRVFGAIEGDPATMSIGDRVVVKARPRDGSSVMDLPVLFSFQRARE